MTVLYAIDSVYPLSSNFQQIFLLTINLAILILSCLFINLFFMNASESKRISMVKYRNLITAVSLFAVSTLFAVEGERAQVEARHMSEEKRAAMEKMNREESSEEVCETQDSLFAPLTEEKKSGFFWDNPAPYYTPAAHWVAEISPLGDTVVMEDGSVWHTNSSDRQKLNHWKISDPIVITQNTSWFSNYTYKIINKATSTQIEATLSLGPLLNGQYTHKIVQIDYVNGKLLLANGSHWNISYSDRQIFNDWLVNDTIIIGINSSWFSSAECILIDVEMNNFVRANFSY